MLHRLVALGLVCLAACRTDARTDGPAEFVASIVEDYDLGFFAGFSGIELSDDGTDVTLLSDNGSMIFGRLGRDEDGRPSGLRRWRLVSIKEPADADLGDRGLDSEGLALTEEGIFVSIERIHAVWRIAPDGAVAERLPRHPDFDAQQENSSFEALAADADGAIYVLPERSGALTRPFPVWRYRDKTWRRVFDLPRRGRFLAVGADFGPDGRLYLLERRFALPYRFATRIRRFTLDGDAIAQEETLLETAPGRHDNLEGLAVWRDGEDAIRLTMVSDDNHSSLQRTEIVEYRMPVEPAGGGR